MSRSYDGKASSSNSQWAPGACRSIAASSIHCTFKKRFFLLFFFLNHCFHQHRSTVAAEITDGGKDQPSLIFRGTYPYGSEGENIRGTVKKKKDQGCGKMFKAAAVTMIDKVCRT